MSTNKSQQEITLPVDNTTARSTSDLLPRVFRTDSNKKFLQSTLDQLTQPGKVKKVNGYVGRKSSPAAKKSDTYLSSGDFIRDCYQLEPTTVVKDFLGNVSFVSDYLDFINSLKISGADVSNHSRLTSGKTYSFNPRVCWDKLVNFRDYVWAPVGLPAIVVAGQARNVESEISVSLETASDSVHYKFSVTKTLNPVVKLYRGQTYTIKVDSVGHPFCIKTSRTTGEESLYSSGVVNNAIEQGTITFKVPVRSPDFLFYLSDSNPNAGGIFEIHDATDNSFIDVSSDIIGRSAYRSSNGISFTNGLKVKFAGKTLPSLFEEGEWVVEGVGSSINLIPASLTDSGPEYIVINRAAIDNNPWSESNRWVHRDVAAMTGVDVSSLLRATRPIVEYDATLQLFNFGSRSIERVSVFDSFTTDAFSIVNGSTGYNVDGVDLADGMTVIFSKDTDPLVRNKIFSVRSTSVTLPGRRFDFRISTHIDFSRNLFVFDAETDINNFNSTFNGHGLSAGDEVTYLNNGTSSIPGLVNRQIYRVEVVDARSFRLLDNTGTPIVLSPYDSTDLQSFEVAAGQKTIIYLEPSDVELTAGCATTISYGSEFAGVPMWFNGSEWKVSQQKKSKNQTPLFDLFDSDGYSFSNTDKYPGSSFAGTAPFRYKLSSNQPDQVLGIPLSYKNINNVGDILFEAPALFEVVEYYDLGEKKTVNAATGKFKIITTDSEEFVSNWELFAGSQVQPIVKICNPAQLIPIDVVDYSIDDESLSVNVIVNGLPVPSEIDRSLPGQAAFVKINAAVSDSDSVILEVFSSRPKNENGFYKIPKTFQHNPSNELVKELTLGQVVDHFSDICSSQSFSGALRDTPSLSKYGANIVRYAGPTTATVLHYGSPEFNVITAIKEAKNRYSVFRQEFLDTLSTLGVDASPMELVSLTLQRMNSNRPITDQFYLSDMFGYSAPIKNSITVLDSRTKIYPLPIQFNPLELSNKSVNIYLNDTQMFSGIDYSIDSSGEFFTVSRSLSEGDEIEIVYYSSTDGAFCPPTPTKLGLYPKFKPEIVVDDSFINPTTVIIGHDGSKTVAFGDYRDLAILELESRIFNNIKVSYDPLKFNIFDFIPGLSRDVGYTREEFDRILSPMFYQWVDKVAAKLSAVPFDRLDPFTFNYRDNYFADNSSTPAYWRGIYKWALDTDKPHLAPWECQGFTIKPAWWEDVYGPAPYTSDNKILWDDIASGTIRYPEGATIDLRMAKPIVSTSGIPVNSSGELVNPIECNYALGYIQPAQSTEWVFGDCAPVEAAYRSSSSYPFDILSCILLMKPTEVFPVVYNLDAIEFDSSTVVIDKVTKMPITASSLKVPSTALSASRVETSGVVNYIVEQVSRSGGSSIDTYLEFLKTLSSQLSYKVSGFTSKEKLKLILDSKNPKSTSGVFVPYEDYSVVLNTSVPVEKVVYSGVMITALPEGFEVKGYNSDEPFFKCAQWDKVGSLVTVGGISESFVQWQPNETYSAGQVVLFSGKFHRAKLSHSTATFEQDYFTPLPDLPVTGGTVAYLRNGWDMNDLFTVPYGTVFKTIQDVVDFLLGYGKYLESVGFVFDYVPSENAPVQDWSSSAKEFMYWTTQQWPSGALLALSPAAYQITLKTNNTVVANVFDRFYGNRLFRVDGRPLNTEFTHIFREPGEFSVAVADTGHGIFGATFYLIQKEHLVLINNTTLFNDIIFDSVSGYKQDRIKVSGYVTTSWSGGLDAPGFVFDTAKIVEWKPWLDFVVGDVVKYKEFYYAADSFVPGSAEFDFSKWNRLEKPPTPSLVPNFDYKANQFYDFYDLDSDNFDTEQQSVARHLIGYQPREYLANILQDDISQYKFYQGMIADKGTTNSLTKLFNIYGSNDESVDVSEEWAVRVGTFGGIDTVREVEIPIAEDLIRLTPQPVEVIDSKPVIDDFVLRVPHSAGYNLNSGSSIFEATEVDRYLRSTGFVSYDDVAIHVNNLDDIIESWSPGSVAERDLVWCGIEGRWWNVYYYLNTLVTPVRADYTKSTSTAVVEFNNVGKVSSLLNKNVPIDTTRKLFYQVDEAPLKTDFDEDELGFDSGETIFDSIPPYDIFTYYAELPESTIPYRIFEIPKGVHKFTLSVAIPQSEETVFDSTSTVFDDAETVFDYRVPNDRFAILLHDTSPNINFSYTIVRKSLNDFEVTISNSTDSVRNFHFIVVNETQTRVDVHSVVTLTYEFIKITAGDVIGIENSLSIDGYYRVLAHTESSISFKSLANIETGEISGITTATIFKFDSKKPQYIRDESINRILRPDPSKVASAFLVNSATSEVITPIDVVDVVAGKIPNIADSELSFKTFYDPAVYSLGDLSNVDPARAWSSANVGMLWWDLTNARFIENQKGNVSLRAARWNKLFETMLPDRSVVPSASIDVYEWVESKLKPSEWDRIADTEKGLALGVSGVSKYGDNSYSVKEKIDTATGIKFVTYYFWVKNKKIVPAVIGRKISAAEVASVIADPVSAGYTCFGFIGENSIVLSNVSQYLSGSNVSLQIHLKTDTEVTKHSQWKLISENSLTTLPKKIEKKWIDSLVGVDNIGQSVPNMAIPARYRYGVESSPSQSMFINRVEALKQTITRINAFSSTMLVSDYIDLSMLNKAEEAPSNVSGAWDIRVDTEHDLKFVKTTYISRAILEPVVEAGKLVSVNIVNSGRGYKSPPTISVVGTGSSAEVVATVDEFGSIVKVDVINNGRDYSDDVLVVCRPFTVLVDSDSRVYDKWSLVSWDAASRQWNMIKAQSYDVRRFWDYADWYADGITQFTKIDYIFDNVASLPSTAETGTISKILNYNSGGWALLRKLEKPSSETLHSGYEVVAREKGTIQFSKSLYSMDRISDGYDELFYDLFLYDNFPIEEIRIILEFAKSELFTGPNYLYYVKLFFVGLRYALSEQLYTDWAFKTSFIKVKHKLGNFKQSSTYKADPLTSFEQYINEVKPYKTKVREFVSSYSAAETSEQMVSDFDLPPSNNLPVDVKLVNGKIETNSDVVGMLPWRSWLDNFAFTVVDVEIVDAGSGYDSLPSILIYDSAGNTASAIAEITESGELSKITVIQSSDRFVEVPTVEIIGGLGITGTPAQAVAIIGNNKVRTVKTAMKFDRISKRYYVHSLSVTETGDNNPALIADGVKKSFLLRFAPKTGFALTEVSIGTFEVPYNLFTVSKKKVTHSGRSFFYGELLFVDPPAAGEVISVSYQKDFEHLSATDRINFYYNPQPGMIGKDLRMLMNGVDYGGTVVSGRDFSAPLGWGSNAWSSGEWDSEHNEFSISFEIIDPEFREFDLGFAPTVGSKVNIYVSDVREYEDAKAGEIRRIDFDPQRDESGEGKVEVFVGTGHDQVVKIPSGVDLSPNNPDSATCFVIFRKEQTETPFDSEISAGSLDSPAGIYSTATGLASSDLVIDGDAFITAANSPAPEEVVPGQVVDTLALKVYTRPSPNLIVTPYYNVVDRSEFEIGQMILSTDSVKVYVDSTELQHSEYSIDWKAFVVSLNDPVTAASVVVVSTGPMSESLLDADFFVSDGNTREFVTKAPWSRDANAVVCINGEIIDNYTLFKTDPSYMFEGVVGIRLPSALSANDVLSFAISSPNSNITFGVPSPQTDLNSLTIDITAVFDNKIVVLVNGTQMYYKKDFDISQSGRIEFNSGAVLPTDNVMMFESPLSHKSFGYVQFKDMLNRTHYKRLSKSRTTRLARDLFVTDNEILVTDASKLVAPKPELQLPGVIFVGGERIEFFKVTGNVLSELRRSTLGTSLPERHRFGLLVVDAGFTETLPYADSETVTKTVLPHGKCLAEVVNGTNVLTVTTTSVSTLLPGQMIDVIVSGQQPITVSVLEAIPDPANPDIAKYKIDTPLTITEAEAEFTGVSTISLPFDAFVSPIDLVNKTYDLEKYQNVADIFVGGYRLKKNPFVIYGKQLESGVVVSPDYPDSPAGDITLPPDFVISENNGYPVVDLAVPTNQEIKMVKRTGKTWHSPNAPLGNSNSAVAKFLREQETIWPQYIVDKYQYILETDQNTSLFIDSTNSDLPPEPLELD